MTASSGAVAAAAAGANLPGTPTAALGVTIFEEMTTLALQTGAINLGQGFPDEDGPAEIKAAAQAAIAAGANQYAPGKGILQLREAVAAHQERFYGLTPDPETEIIVTTGATEAIAAALLALVGPGRRGPDLRAVLRLLRRHHRAGRRHATPPPRCWPRTSCRTWTPSKQRSPTAPGWCCVNNPHNPTGAVFPREVLAARRRACPQARRRDHHRRGLRAPHLRCPAHPGRHAARRGRDGPSPSPRPERRSPSPAGRSAGSPARSTWWRRSAPSSSS